MVFLPRSVSQLRHLLNVQSPRPRRFAPIPARQFVHRGRSGPDFPLISLRRRHIEPPGIHFFAGGDAMTNMNDRRDAFENKFAHDEELKFKATARRNKLLGLWAAEKLGKSGDAADAYAREVIASDFEEAGGQRRLPQGPQGFRCGRRRPVGPPDSADDGRADGRRRRTAHQGLSRARGRSRADRPGSGPTLDGMAAILGETTT
jgi:hypothetical protein